MQTARQGLQSLETVTSVEVAKIPMAAKKPLIIYDDTLYILKSLFMRLK